MGAGLARDSDLIQSTPWWQRGADVLNYWEGGNALDLFVSFRLLYDLLRWRGGAKRPKNDTPTPIRPLQAGNMYMDSKLPIL